jgi:general secretion pathway protein J
MRAPRSRNSGFTLIEAMIALSIFSFLGVAAYQLLSSTAALKEAGDKRFEVLSGLQSALRLLEEDLMQLSPRSVAGASADRLPALDGAPALGVLELTRSGLRNPLGLPRSRLQRVAWEVDDEGTLLRHTWFDVDARNDTEPLTRVVVADVESLSLRFRDAEGIWGETWPPRESTTAPGVPDDETVAEPLPQAIEVHLMHKQIGELVRVIPVR